MPWPRIEPISPELAAMTRPSIESELGTGTTISVFLPEAKPSRKITPAPSGIFSLRGWRPT